MYFSTLALFLTLFSLLCPALSNPTLPEALAPRACNGEVCGSNCCTFITRCANAKKSMCCLSGEVDTNGICCQPGSTNVGGRCCAPGGVNVNGTCCMGKKCMGGCCPGICYVAPFGCKRTKEGCVFAGGSGDFCQVKMDCPRKSRKRAACSNGCCTYQDIIF